MQNILVTGAAGFIGYHVAERLLSAGRRVVGLDNLNDYYDVALKRARLARLVAAPGFRFHELDVASPQAEDLIAEGRFDGVVHLAAQAGVRYSIEAPHTYISCNLVGFARVLEGCRRGAPAHLVYASSSSVYGANTRLPFSEQDTVDHPVSLYAATKKANELLAHSYAHLYRMPVTGLRFFTVYGPFGRPDMALFRFTRAILEGEPIDLYNEGNMLRDFTYVDDVVEGVVRVLERPAQPDTSWSGERPNPATSSAPYAVYNIGNSSPTPLLEVVEHLEAALGREAIKRLLPMQPGDVPATYADTARLEAAVGFHPSTNIKLGITRFVSWYREFYRV